MCKLPLRYNFLVEISNNVYRGLVFKAARMFINISLLNRVIVCLQRASVVFRNVCHVRHMSLVWHVSHASFVSHVTCVVTRVALASVERQAEHVL